MVNVGSFPVGKVILQLAGALLGPFVLFSLYLAVSRWPVRWFTGVSDYAAMAVAAGIGLGFIWFLPVRLPWRVLFAALLTLLLWLSLLPFGLLFVGGVFGDWL